MMLLAIDTAANLCAACVFDAALGVERGRMVRDIGKGHAEALMGVVEGALRAAGVGYRDLAKIGVAVGPGSFTGVRVGVATARGLALALGRPAVGVTTLEALAAEARRARPGRAVLAAIDARRGELYAALYDADGRPITDAAVLRPDEAGALAARYDALVTGSAAPLIAAFDGSETLSTAATADIATYARLAAAVPPGAERPRPLYLRAADAKPQSGLTLPRQDG